jgi:hypothetical protein
MLDKVVYVTPAINMIKNQFIGNNPCEQWMVLIDAS